MEAEPLELEDGEIVDDEVRDTDKFLSNESLTHINMRACVNQINEHYLPDYRFENNRIIYHVSKDHSTLT